MDNAAPMTKHALNSPAAAPAPANARPALLSDARLLLITVLLALAFLGWEAAGGDAWLASWAGGAAGFSWSKHWLLTGVMHGGGRTLAWTLALALCVAVRWPLGPLRLLGTSRRLQLALGVLLSVLAVSLLKSVNPAACPWDLVAYGGAVQPVSHWDWWTTPAGGRGRCFPAGHASAGFAFIGGFFVFRTQAPVLARRWLLAALAAGLLLGLSQQWRGAHFMSHTLWTGWVCWCLAWGLDGLHRRFFGTAQPRVAAA